MGIGSRASVRYETDFQAKTLLLSDYHPSFEGMYIGAKTARFWSAASPARAAGQVSAKILLYENTGTLTACGSLLEQF